MELLASLGCVSYVVKFDEDTPYELIKKIQPNIITKAGDYKEDDIEADDDEDFIEKPQSFNDYIKGFSPKEWTFDVDTELIIKRTGMTYYY